MIRFLSFKNDDEHELGETPIPGGLLKVYRNVDEQGHLSYTGQSSFKYIPVDEDVELNLGPVNNVVVEPKLMDVKYENHRYDTHHNIAGWDEVRKFKIEVRNTRELPIRVEIKRVFQDQYWKIENSGEFGEYEKYDLRTAKYSLDLEPNSVKVFEYELREYFGTRKEDWRE